MTFETIHHRLTTRATALEVDDSIQQYACLIVDELEQQGTHISDPGRTATACLLAACRLQEHPIRVTVLAEQTDATKNELLGELRRISRELEFGIPLDEPEHIIEQACHELSLSETIEERAIQLARLGEEGGVTSGVSPYTYSAAVLYMVSSPLDVDLSQADIAAQFDVSTATLRNRRDELLETTSGRLFALQFPDAPPEAATLVETVLVEMRDSDWAANKRALGLLGGAWLYAVSVYDLETTAGEIATLTGVSEPTIHTRLKEISEHCETDPQLKSRSTDSLVS